MSSDHDKHVAPFDQLLVRPWLTSTYFSLRNKASDAVDAPEQEAARFDLTEIRQDLRSVTKMALYGAGNQSVALRSLLSPRDLKGTKEGLSQDSKLLQLLRETVTDYDDRMQTAINQAFVASFGISGQIESGIQLDVDGSLQAAHQMASGALDLLTLMVSTINGYKGVIDSLEAHLDSLNMEYMSRFQGNQDEAKKRRDQAARGYQYVTEADILSTAVPTPLDSMPNNYRSLTLRYFDRILEKKNIETDIYDCWYRHGLTQRQTAGLTNVSQPTVHRLINDRFPEALERLNAALGIEQQAEELGLSVDTTIGTEGFQYHPGFPRRGPIEQQEHYGSDLYLKDTSGTVVAKVKIIRIPVEYPIKDATRDDVFFPGFSTDAPGNSAARYLWVYPATYTDFESNAPNYALEFNDSYEPSQLVPDNGSSSILSECSWTEAPDAAVAIAWKDGKVSIHPSGVWEDPYDNTWDFTPEKSDYPVNVSPKSVDDWFEEIDQTMFSDFLNSFQETPPSLKDYFAFVGKSWDREAKNK